MFRRTQRTAEPTRSYQYEAVVLDEQGRDARCICQARDLEPVIDTAVMEALEPGERVVVRSILDLVNAPAGRYPVRDFFYVRTATPALVAELKKDERCSSCQWEAATHSAHRGDLCMCRRADAPIARDEYEYKVEVAATLSTAVGLARLELNRRGGGDPMRALRYLDEAAEKTSRLLDDALLARGIDPAVLGRRPR